ncbi:MAG TPA: YbaB/EbfC family nucleoid-associated protein [Candidatus Sphingobacterium stercoripullorum]|uniref:YbaB/EbfC family nucleoid-associated protein n=1 Tax=Candidatus Sphingobacterium stercoripullorum TaxID=2838759 RepID=A0A9D2AZP3_9SPHI|nr:YbaB/EbfC family nucleoid-associated protein [Candidatus Sphingobacterium stercoripullorum]
MWDKLNDAKKKAEEVKARLQSISVQGEVESGKIRVIASADKEIKEVIIDEDFYKQCEREELQELIAVAANKALEQAESISQTEMQTVTQDMLGGLGGLGALGNMFK